MGWQILLLLTVVVAAQQHVTRVIKALSAYVVLAESLLLSLSPRRRPPRLCCYVCHPSLNPHDRRDEGITLVKSLGRGSGA